MRRLAIGLALLGLVAAPVPSAAQEECTGGATTPEDTASLLVGEYLAGGQWDLAYEVLHPEAQLRVLRQAFAAARQTEAIVGPLLDVEVFPARIARGWTWGITGVRFTEVSEVPVRVTRGALVATVPTVQIIPFARVGDCWRWLPPRLP